MDAVAGARPEPALDVEPEAVEEPAGARGEDAAVRELSGLVHVEGANVARPVLHVRRPGIGHVELPLVGREGDAVRADEVVRRDAHGARLRIHPVDVAGPDLAPGLVAFIVAVDSVGRVGEPDRAVRPHHDVVRRIQALALEPVGDDGHRTVVLGAADAPPAVLAGDEAALPVHGVAVRIVRRAAEHADGAARLVVPHHAVVRDVAPDEIASRREIGRPLGPTAARV